MSVRGEDWKPDWKAYHDSVRAYYQNPNIVWIESDAAAAGGPIEEPGYYVLHSCGEPGCCRPAGPFSSIEQALEFSRSELVAQENARETLRKTRDTGAQGSTPEIPKNTAFFDP